MLNLRICSKERWIFKGNKEELDSGNEKLMCLRYPCLTLSCWNVHELANNRSPKVCLVSTIPASLKVIEPFLVVGSILPGKVK